MAGTFGKRTTGFGAPHPGSARSPTPAPRAQPATDETPTLRFDYRPEPLAALLLTVAAGVMAISASWIARGNDRGLIIDYVIRLDRGQATIFWWSGAALFGVAFVVALLRLVLAVSPPRSVILDPTGITMPRHALLSATVRVGYATITGLRIVTVKRHRFLYVHHIGGKLHIAEAEMGGAFDAMVAALAKRRAAGR